MAVTVCDQLQYLIGPNRDRKRKFRGDAERAAFLCKIDAQHIRDARAFIEKHNQLPEAEDTSRRGRKPGGLRSSRVAAIRETIRKMNLRGESPCYESVCEEMSSWGLMVEQVRWACQRMGLRFQTCDLFGDRGFHFWEKVS